MYVSINLTHMQLMHKHENREVTANLAWIEGHEDGYEIGDYTAKSWLLGVPQHKLKKLYLNITGKDTAYGDAYLRAILSELCHRADVTECTATEVLAQAVYCDKGSAQRRYRKGTGTPANELADWSERGLRVERRSDEATIGAAGYKHYERSGAMPTSDSASRVDSGQPRAVPANPRAPSAPRTGSVRDAIHAKADELWEEAGKPTDKSVVLALRKRIMDVLESEGVKRTSSSNELGNWAKLRIA